MTYVYPDSDKPFAFCYVRMSTAIQLRGDSLRRQTENARRYAASHNLHLLEDFKLEDIGVSAFRSANVRKGPLADFLEAVEAGEIPKGSYLLLEAFDRLSRDETLIAFKLFTSILEAGINIVTLIDQEVYTRENLDFQKIIMSIMKMSVAHTESINKSDRIGHVWANKRKNIRNRKLTKICPGWLVLSESANQYDILPERVKIVQKIFELANNGDGSFVIARQLNSEHVDTFGKAKLWAKSSVTKILNNRSVLGEYQPHVLVNRKRIPSGDVIQDYFPSIISSDLFFQVQSGRRGRQIQGKGRRGGRLANLFTNLAKCQYCKGAMHYVNKGDGPSGGSYLVCYRALSSKSCNSVGWRYDDFETSFLYFCRELDLRSIAVEAEKKQDILVAKERILHARMQIETAIAEREKVFNLLTSVNTPYVAEKLRYIEDRLLEHHDTLRISEDYHSKLSRISEVSDFQIIDFIASFKQKGDNSMPQRKALRKRILDSIEILLLAPAGTEPYSDIIPPIPEKIDLLLSDKLRVRYKERSREPFFSVKLVGDVYRIVGVDPADPTKMRRVLNMPDGITSAALDTDRPGEFGRMPVWKPD